MSANQAPAAFIAGLFETQLHVKNLARPMEFYEKTLGLELGLTEQARHVAIYWIGGHGKTALGLWERPPWASERNVGDQITRQDTRIQVRRVALCSRQAQPSAACFAVGLFHSAAGNAPRCCKKCPASALRSESPRTRQLQFRAASF